MTVPTGEQRDAGLDLQVKLVPGYEGSDGQIQFESIDISRINGRYGNLDISFQRTVRVADNAVVNELPPSCGSFPLFNTADHADNLPEHLQNKGGLFFPMYRKFNARFQSCVEY